MDKFTRIALTKVNKLIKQDGFTGISSINPSFVILEFKSQSCTVTNFGKVCWAVESNQRNI